MSKFIFHYFLPLFLFTLSLVLRTYRFSTPLADWHSWRQSDTASVAREYLKHGVDLLYPRYQDLSSIPSGADNLEGYRMVEFPLLPALHATLASHFSFFNLIEWGRALSIFASSLSTLVIYFLLLSVSSLPAALAGGLFYAVLPYNLFYGRAILPEPWLVLFSLASLAAFFSWWRSPKLTSYLLTLVFLALALLLKPTALTLVFPFFLLAVLSPYGHRPSHYFLLLFLFLLALLPYLAWRHWITQFPAGIPASDWLFNGNDIRFKGAWFRWLFGERVGKLILGYWATVPVTWGLLSLGKRREETALAAGLSLGALAYLIVIATGNVQHDYYQIQIIPALAVLFGLGTHALLDVRSQLRRLAHGLVLLSITLLSFALSWYEIRAFFNINNLVMVEAGAALDRLVSPDALVIAPYQGDTAFLFATNRRGWPIGGEIENKIKWGAQYYVTTTFDDEYHLLASRYSQLAKTESYAILDLTRSLP